MLSLLGQQVLLYLFLFKFIWLLKYACASSPFYFLLVSWVKLIPLSVLFCFAVSVLFTRSLHSLNFLFFFFVSFYLAFHEGGINNSSIYRQCEEDLFWSKLFESSLNFKKGLNLIKFFLHYNFNKNVYNLENIWPLNFFIFLNSFYWI